MRILYVSDIHYSLKQLDWLLAAAQGFDALVIAGDLLDLGGHADLDTQAVVITKYLERLGAAVPVAVCSGNHDLDGQTASGERQAEWLAHLELDRVSVDNQSAIIANCRFSICPWWDGPETQAAVAQFLAAEAKHAMWPWVWVYHAPPDGAKTSWNGKNYSSDAMLVELIHKHKPDIVLSGHIHGSPFRKEGRWYDRIGHTWVFNPGRQPSAIPSSIVIDLDAKTATWHSDMDDETIDLAAPVQA
jgi:Icc-related predicted phosphoesterase